MKDFRIGTQVTVSALARVEYDEHGNKFVQLDQVTPFSAYVVGIRRKLLGKYKKGSGYYGFTEDFEPASLKVTGSVLLWEVRKTLKSASLLVRDEDIKRDSSEKLAQHALRQRVLEDAGEFR